MSSSLRFSFLLLSLALVAGFSFAGCGRRRLPSPERRAVTAEIVAAAEKVSTPKPEITIRPEVRGWFGLPWPVRGSVDHIYVTLPGETDLPVLRQAIEAIARRHHLELAQPGEDGARFDLSYRGERTHSIHVAVATTESPAAGRARTPARGGKGTGPRLAIIIDDMGHDRAAADSLLALRFPLTLSVLPHLPLSREIANAAYRRNDQVMLHLPMESEGESVPSEGTKPEPIELRVGMNAAQVDDLVAGMLDSVPHAIGVNNHQGSRATADPALMQAVMQQLRTRGLFFIDSRTSAATVAYDTAHAAGVRAASRKVFLDDAPAREAVIKQLELAARDAARDGSAIAIGHPHAGTLAALAEEVPRLEARGVRVVFVSELAQ